MKKYERVIKMLLRYGFSLGVSYQILRGLKKKIPYEQKMFRIAYSIRNERI